MIAAAEEMKDRCMRRYTVENSGFLDMRQQSLIMEKCRADRDILMTEYRDGAGYDRPAPGDGFIRGFFYGGYEDAERRILIFMSEYDDIDEVISGDGCPLALLRVCTGGGNGKKLTHRDYLGSLLALGIKREKTGDILVRDDGADIVILKELGEYLLANYNRAGRTELSVSLEDISCIKPGSVHVTEKRDTVASLRLDSLTASAFGVSRAKAQEKIRAGLVFINGAEAGKPDIKVCEGDKIVMRGSGKAVLREISGKSRKDWICVIIDKYE